MYKTPRIVDGLSITMSPTHEPIHGHVTANCQEYHDIPMKHYKLVFELHMNMCNHQRRQWFRCTLRHLLRRRRYYKWNFWLAHVLSLLLLLEDVELNPSPCQSETHDELGLPAPAVNPAIDQTGAEDMYCKVKKFSGMAMQLVCQRKWLDTETVEEHCARLVKVADNQRLWLQCCKACCTC